MKYIRPRTPQINPEYLPPAPKPPVGVRIKDGGITDKGQTELLQLGNLAQIQPPPSDAATAGVTALWVNGADPAVILAQAAFVNLGVIMQARSAVPDHPEVLCVNINPPFVDTTNLQIWYELKVRASWGVGADRCQAIIDAAQGAQFSVVATELLIEGIYTVVNQNTHTPVVANMGANIGERTRSGSAFGPSFTSIITAAGVGKIVNVAVPPYAKAVTVYPAVAAGTPVAVNVGFVNSTSAAGNFVSITQAANGCPCTYPLPNDVLFVKLTFANADDVALVRFDLAL